jgi:hypothetical protein
MNSLLLSSYQITHNDNLNVSVTSNIYDKEIYLYIIDSENYIHSIGYLRTDLSGDGLQTNIQIDSIIPRSIHSLVAFYSSENEAGIGKQDFEITTYPTSINPYEAKIVSNYKQNFLLEVDFINEEIEDHIDFANVEYFWEFGSGVLQQDIDSHYFVNVINSDANPGNYFMNITGSKNGYATAKITMEIEIVFEDYNLTLLAPDNAIPGELLTFKALVLDNYSSPVSNTKIRFLVNEEPLSETWTNSSGYAEVTYPLSPIYSFETLNISSSILIDEIPFLTRNKVITIAITDTPQVAQLESIIQNTNKINNITSFFNYTITYPVFGKNWYVQIPSGLNISEAKIYTDSTQISVNKIDNYLTWVREVNTSLTKQDILELEIYKPEQFTTPTIKNNKLSINIIITTNNLPYQNLEIKITRDSQWEAFDQWNLYHNDILITDSADLIVTTEYITFKINSTQQDTTITYNLEATKSNLIEISPATVILGIGTLAITVISIVLLFKKKSNVSLDIHV